MALHNSWKNRPILSHASRRQRIRWGKVSRTGLLHPKQMNAKFILKSIQKLAERGEDYEFLFMCLAHLLGAWAPLLRYCPEKTEAIRKSRAMLALAVTEKQSGSDFSRMKSTYNKVQRRISGEKTYVTNGPICDYCLVLAKEKKHIKVFILSSSQKNIRFQELPERLAMPKASAGDIVFKNVLVEPEQMLSTPGVDFFRYAMAWERGLIFAPAPIYCRQLLKKTKDLLKKRKRFGQPLAKQKEIAKKLENLKSKIEEMQGSLAKAADSLDKNSNSIFQSMETKVLCSQSFQYIVRELFLLAGRDALLASSPWAQAMQISLASHLYSGPDALLRSLLGHEEKLVK